MSEEEEKQSEETKATEASPERSDYQANYPYAKKNRREVAIGGAVFLLAICMIVAIVLVFTKRANDNYKKIKEQNASDILTPFAEDDSDDEESINLKLPETPLTINTYGYSGSVEVTAQITDIEVKSEYGFTTVTVTAEMTYNNSYSSSTYAEAKYKVLDSKGVIVDNGTLMIGSMSVGDKKRGEIHVLNLKPGEEYTLVIEDYTY